MAIGKDQNLTSNPSRVGAWEINFGGNNAQNPATRPIDPKLVDPVRPSVMPNPGRPVIPTKPPLPIIDPVPKPPPPSVKPPMPPMPRPPMPPAKDLRNVMTKNMDAAFAGKPLPMGAPQMSEADLRNMSQAKAMGEMNLHNQTEGMLQRPPVPMKKGGKAQSYTTKDGKINLGSGRVSTASKSKKNSNW